MKKAIPCKFCAHCAVIQPAGFLAKELLYCEAYRDEVSELDGCTKGVKGMPHRATLEAYVDISNEAAV